MEFLFLLNVMMTLEIENIIKEFNPFKTVKYSNPKTKSLNNGISPIINRNKLNPFIFSRS